MQHFEQRDSMIKGITLSVVLKTVCRLGRATARRSARRLLKKARLRVVAQRKVVTGRESEK